MFNNNEWLEQVSEAVIDPERDIVDPHHHLWPQASMGYNIDELLADTSDGHAVKPNRVYGMRRSLPKGGA